MTENRSKDEPLEDSYLDVSNYGIMATIVGRGKWGSDACGKELQYSLGLV